VAVTHKLALLVCYEADSYDVRRGINEAGSALSLSSEKGGLRSKSPREGDRNEFGRREIRADAYKLAKSNTR
jgi:hypothetical protein